MSNKKEKLETPKEFKNIKTRVVRDFKSPIINRYIIEIYEEEKKEWIEYGEMASTEFLSVAIRAAEWLARQRCLRNRKVMWTSEDLDNQPAA